MIWFTFYEQTGYTNHHGARSVKQTSDGGFAFVVNDLDALVPRAIMVKTDGNSMVEWAQEYGSSSSNERFSSVVEAFEGGYILAGTDNGPADDPVLYLVKTTDVGISGCDEISADYLESSPSWLPQSALISDSAGYGPQPDRPLVAVSPYIATKIACECCAKECDIEAPWGDANDDGIGLSVGDMVYLAGVVIGDEPIFSGCGSEMDGFRNPAFSCSPTLGDLIVAYFRRFDCLSKLYHLRYRLYSSSKLHLPHRTF
jgi:hypothetical protein